MKKIIFTLALVFLSFSQIISQSISEKKQSKKERETAEYKQIKEIINSGKFIFLANWSFPQGGRRIDLTTNQDQVRIENGEAKIYLPYFGSVQSSRAASGGGIEYEGKLEIIRLNLMIKRNEFTYRFRPKAKPNILIFLYF